MRGEADLEWAEGARVSVPVEDDHAARALQRDESPPERRRARAVGEVPGVQDVVTVEEVQHRH